MSTSVDTLWSRCMEDLATQIPSQTLETWFKPIRPLDCSRSEFRLEAPSQFFINWVEQHYYPILQRVIRSRAGEDVDVVFDIAETQVIEITPPPQPLPPPEVEAITGGGLLDPIALNPRFRFDSFVVGNSNEFAYAASKAVAEAPGRTAFNPLLVYGGVGLGKTHLLQAIATYAIEQGTATRVMYISSEKFISDFITSIQNHQTVEFTSLYRNVDILLVDDIQFFTNKERTQEEFFHTFNTLHQRGKQIVLTCDRMPRDVPGLEERLTSRFLWGLVTDIQTPDFETRVAIMQKKADTDGVSVPNDVLLFIAQHIKSNIRELESCLIKLLAYSSLTGREISTDMAMEILHDQIEYTRKGITIETLQETVASHYNIPSDMMRARTRKKEIVVPRQVAMYLCKHLTDSSLKTIGLHFGGRDHTTVIHAYQTVEEKLGKNPHLKRDVDAILSTLEVDPGVI